MLEYARWKYVLILIVLLLSVLYALPNVFPQDPSVQITANRGSQVDAALHAHLNAIGDFHSDEAVAQRTHSAGDAAAGEHFIAHRQLFDHGLVLLGTPHLRPDHHEIHDGDQRNGKQQGGHEAAGGRGRGRGLRKGGGNQPIEQRHQTIQT